MSRIHSVTREGRIIRGRKSRLPAWIAAGVAMLGLTIGHSPASAAGNPDAGLHLAQRWCSSCHSVDGSSNVADTAPSFPDIAQAKGQDKSWLRAWLMAPHPRMPNFNLSRAEIDDLVAYLSKLAERGR